MTEEKQEAGETSAAPPGDPAAFENWIQGQAPDIQAMIEAQTAGLRRALESERSERKRLDKEFREAARRAEAGSDAQRALQEAADRLATAERLGGFYEAAHAAGASNLRLLWIAAQDAGLIGADGSADFGKIRQQFPELFRTPAPPANAGNGTGSPPPRRLTMNDFIRQAAGRGPAGS